MTTILWNSKKCGDTDMRRGWKWDGPKPSETLLSIIKHVAYVLYNRNEQIMQCHWVTSFWCCYWYTVFVKRREKKLESIVYVLNCLIWIDADYLDSYRIVHFAVIHRFFFNLFHFFIRHIEMSIQWWNQSIFSLILYHWLYSGCLLAHSFVHRSNFD